MKYRFLFILPLLGSMLLLSSCGKKETPRTLVSFEGPQGLVCEIAGVTLKRNTLRLPPGKYVIGFSAPGHVTEYRHVTVPGDPKFSCKVSLAPVTASALVRSTPAGATVMLNGKSMGITPVVIRDLPPGRYRAELSMRGFATIPVTWEINSERPVAVHASLDSNQGSVTITSAPSRARVIVDSKEVGETPYTLQRDEGKYLIRLERAGCNPEERSVHITKGRKSRLFVRLGQKPGSIRVTSDPAGAEVIVNGRKWGVTPCFVESLAAGEYTLSLNRQGYDPVTSKIQITAGTLDSRHFKLSSSTGSVVFNVQPVGVEVFLNGKSLGVTRPVAKGAESTVDFRVSNLAPGKYTVTMFHSLGDPPRQSFSFNVRKNRSTTLRPRAMWLANCELTYSDGSKERGFLRDNQPGYVIFSPEPGVQFRVERNKIKGLIMLKGVQK